MAFTKIEVTTTFDENSVNYFKQDAEKKSQYIDKKNYGRFRRRGIKID